MDSTTLDGTVARTRVLLRAVVDAPMDSRSTPARLAKAGSKPSPQPTTPQVESQELSARASDLGRCAGAANVDQAPIVHPDQEMIEWHLGARQPDNDAFGGVAQSQGHGMTLAHGEGQ